MPDLDPRDLQKWAAKRRAELALKHAFERIDWKEDVIKPELQKMKDGLLVLDSTGDAATDAYNALNPGDEK